jgi:aldose 1-epimerase
MKDRNTVRFGSILFSLVALIAGVAPAWAASLPGKRMIEKTTFGKTPDGHTVDLYTLTNSHGVEVRVMNYGGIVVSLRVPDRAGKLDDVVLGYDNFAEYLDNKPYFGAIIGRFGNRIARGEFTLDGTTYHLAKNNGPNSLHSGLKGFDKVLWDAEPFTKDQAVGVVFTYTSKDGEEGFPGNLKTRVTYTLDDQNELEFACEATTDKATPVNLTHHSYFNLRGEGNGDVLNHEIAINADRFAVVDSALIPSGELRSVTGTPLDFRTSHAIGARINDPYEQLVVAGGYDHTFVLNRKRADLVLAARMHEPKTGRVLEVYTTEPGLQFYTGNFLDGSAAGKNGHHYARRSAFCLEAQHFPDSPNHPDFPTTILRPGQTYSSRAVYKFSTQ